MIYEKKDKETDKKIENWLSKHKYLNKIAYFLHLSQRPIAFLGVLIGFIITIFSITGIILVLNNPDSLKIETDQLCQSITDFMANRELERPSTYDYDWNEMDNYSKDINTFNELTKSMFISRFSNDVMDCYNEYNKRNIKVDSMMYDQAVNPTNLFSIYDTIKYLKLLENKL